MYDEDKWFMGTILVLTLVFIGFMVYVVNCADKALEERTLKCQQAGGELLDRTYRVGKHTNHLYPCIDPSVLKDID